MVKDKLFSGESKNIEYKVTIPDKSEKYMKTVVAFANTQGGKLVIGIDDKTHQVVGVDKESLFPIMDHWQMRYLIRVSHRLFRILNHKRLMKRL